MMLQPSILRAFTLASFGVALIIGSGGTAFSEEPERTIPTGSWSKTSMLTTPEGTVSVKVKLSKLDFDPVLHLEISVLPDHPTDIYYLNAHDAETDEESLLLCLGQGPVIETFVGVPEVSHEGLEKMILLKAGKGYSANYAVNCQKVQEYIENVRIRLLFLMDRIEFFREQFSRMEDTGYFWYTEIGTPIWCDYMSSLVSDELSIPITGGPGPCQVSAHRKSDQSVPKAREETPNESLQRTPTAAAAHPPTQAAVWVR